jgi:hypothetical protein
MQVRLLDIHLKLPLRQYGHRNIRTIPCPLSSGTLWGARTMKSAVRSVAFVCVVTLAASQLAVTPAAAGGGRAGAVAAGVITGVAIGAIAAGAAAQARPVYVAPAQPVYVDCTKKKIVRTDAYGDRIVTKKEVCR